MAFTRFVQVGRVVILKSGPKEGAPAVIVDIVDQNRVLIDGPLSGVKRQIISVRQISLTGIVIKLPQACRTGVVKRHMEESNVMETFNATAAAKKIAARKRRATLTDFERFQVMVLKRQKRSILTGCSKASKQ